MVEEIGIKLLLFTLFLCPVAILTHIFNNLLNFTNPISVFTDSYLVLMGFSALFIPSYLNIIFINDNILVAIVAGLYAFFIGSILSDIFYVKSGKVTNRYSKLTLKSSEIQLKSSFIAAKIVFFMGIMFGIYFYYKMSMIPILLREDIEMLRVEAKKGISYLFLACLSFIHIGVLPIFFYYLRRKRTLRFLPYLVVSLFILLGGGFRGDAFYLLLGVFIVFSYHRYGKIKLGQTLIFIIFALILLVILGYYRSAGSLRLLHLSFFLEKIKWRFFTNILGFGLIYDKFSDSLMFLHGRSYLMDLRVILPGYQPSFGIWLKEFLDFRFRGGSLNPSVLGESYANFGFWGIIVILFLLGFALKFVYNIIKKKETNIYRLLLLIFFSFFSLQIVVSGLGATLISFLLPHLAAFMTFYFVAAILGNLSRKHVSEIKK